MASKVAKLCIPPLSIGNDGSHNFRQFLKLVFNASNQDKRVMERPVVEKAWKDMVYREKKRRSEAWTKQKLAQVK